MRGRVILVAAAAVAVLGLVTLARPFNLAAPHDPSPNVDGAVTCSAPIVQLVHPPKTGLERTTGPDENGRFAQLYPNPQPRCREVGRSRAAAGLAVLAVGAVLIAGYRRPPQRNRPRPASTQSASNST
jgi:hypothetical protein